MSTTKLNIVEFFIPLPEILPLAEGYSVTITEPFNPREKFAIYRAVNGITEQSRVKLTFHQEERLEQDPQFSAMSAVFYRHHPREDGSDSSDAKMEKQANTTVIRAACVVDDTKSFEVALTDSFDLAVEKIREYQKAYHLVTQHACELLTRKNTYPVILYSLAKIDDKGAVEVTDKMGIFIINMPTRLAPVPIKLSKDEINKISNATIYLGNVLSQFVNVRREAARAYEEGNTVVASLLIGIASEILLDELLLALLWEECWFPENVARVFIDNDSIFGRITSDLYSSRLDGEWSFDDAGPIRDWRNKVLNLRNKIAHIGYEPTLEETDRAYSALQVLTTHVIDLLCQKIERYPVISQLFAGNEGLENRKLLEQHRALKVDLVSAVDPAKNFGNWKFEVDRFRYKSSPIGVIKKSVVTYVFHKNGKEYWALNDQENRLLKIIPEPDFKDPESKEATFKNLGEVRTKISHPSLDQNYVVEFSDLKPPRIHNNSDPWIPSYVVSDLQAISAYPVSYLFPPQAND